MTVNQVLGPQAPSTLEEEKNTALTKLRTLVSPPIFDDEEPARVASILNAAILLILIATILGTLVLIPFEPANTLSNVSVGVVLVLIFVGLRSLLFRGQVRVVGIILTFTLWMTTTLFVYTGSGLHDPTVTAYFLVVALAGLVLGSNWAVAFGVLSALATMGIAYAEMSGMISPVVSDVTQPVDLVTLNLSLGLTMVLIRSAIHSITQGFERVRRNEQVVSEHARQLKERTRELEASQRVTFAASERVSPDELLGLVVDLIRDQFDLYHVQIYLVDEEQDAAVLRESTGYAGQQLLQKGHLIPLDRPALVTQTIREGQPVLVADVSLEPGFMPNPLLPETQSELVVPLKIGGQVIGVLDVQSRMVGRFNESTVALFQTMTEQIAFLLENSDLLERVSEQTDALTRFTTRLRTAADLAKQINAILDPDQLLHEVVNQLQERFNFYHVHAYLLDKENGDLTVRAGSGGVGEILCEQGHHIPLDHEKSLVARAARTRKIVSVQDTSLESGFLPNPLLPETRSEVAMPLVVGEKVLGVLDVQDNQPGRFTPADLNVLSTLTGQIATALQNAGLFEEQKRAEERLTTILESSPSPTVVSRLADGAVLYVNKPLSDLFGLPKDAWMGRETPDFYYDPNDRQEILAVLQKNGHLHQKEVRLKKGDGTPFWALISIQPMVFEGAPAVVTGIYDISARKQAEMERERFTNQLRTAADLAEQINAILDPDQLLPAVVAQLHDRFDLYHVHIYLLDDPVPEILAGADLQEVSRIMRDRQLVMRAGSGDVGQELLARGHGIPLVREQSLVARAARTRKTVAAQDTSVEPDFMPNPLLPDTRSEVAIPLVAGDKVLGVLDVQDDQPNRFTQSDFDTFNTLAGQISTALSNADLFEQTQARLRVSQVLAGTQTEEEVLDAMIQVADFYPEVRVAIITLEHEPDGLTAAIRRSRAAEGEPLLPIEPGMRFPASMFPLLQLISPDEPFMTADVLTDERVDPMTREMAKATGSHSLAALPVTEGNQWLGVVAVLAKEEGYLGRKLYLYQSLSNQGAVALRTARLRDAVQRSLEETEIRLGVSQALAEAQREEEVLDVIIEQSALYPKTQTLIFTSELEAEETTVVVRRCASFDSTLPLMIQEGMRFPASQFQMMNTIEPGAVFISPNFAQDERVDQAARELAEQMGTAAIAIIPLMDGNVVLGNIAVFSEEESYFDEQKLGLYKTLAEQGSIALRLARFYDEIQRTAERLREMDKFKSEFLASMSHELRTPLNSIIGFAEVLLMGISGDLDPEVTEDIQAIYDNGQHLLRLINDVLDLAKIEAGRLTLDPEPIQIPSLLKEIVTNNAGLLVNKPVETQIEVPDDIPAIEADPVRLNQVLNNLMSNAVKFTEKGTITLRAHVSSVPPMPETTKPPPPPQTGPLSPEALERATQGDNGQPPRENWISIEVQDTGIGISPENLENIFEQFRQVDGSSARRAEGTGLGLTITRHLVKMHGGTIQVRSQLGKGSTFTVYLPVEQPETEGALQEQTRSVA